MASLALVVLQKGKNHFAEEPMGVSGAIWKPFSLGLDLERAKKGLCQCIKEAVQRPLQDFALLVAWLVEIKN